METGLETKISTVADLYWQARNQRLDMQKTVDALEAVEKGLKKDLIEMMTEAEITAIGGELVEVTIVKKNEPVVERWSLLWGYIQATGEFDLLYKRVNAAAVKERWELNKEVAGVGVFPTITLSLHARK
jgi:hypothetical protein